MNGKTPHIDETILTKFLSGEATTSEINKVLDWVDFSDENRVEFARFEKLWSETKTHKTFDANKAWGKIDSRITSKKRTLRIVYSSVAAAVIALFVVLVQLKTDVSTNTPNFVLASADTSINTMLPDSSEITLSEKSKIEYQFDTKTKIRHAKLEGKAFFHVKRDTSERFIVETRYGGVEVLGTKFKVDMLENSDVKVDVLSGKVKVFLPTTSSDTLYQIITNGETAIISVTDDSIMKVEQAASAFFDINKTLLFKHVYLSSIVAELEKCYPVTIKIDSTVNQNLMFSSSFNNNSVDEVLTVVSQTLNLAFHQKNNVYYISKKDDE